MDLRDQLDWRLRLIGYGLEHLADQQGEPTEGRIIDDLGMAVRECQLIVGGVSDGGIRTENS